jgi:hypothetical protein
MSHVVYRQVNWVDSQLFLVRSQIGNLTPIPSFGNNLCFRYLNEQCKPISDIYVPRAFQWYKKRYKPLSFDPWNCFMKFRESTETPSPKVGVALGVWGFTPSHFLTLSGVCDVTHRLSLGPHPRDPFCLSHEPKAKVATRCFFDHQRKNSAYNLFEGKHSKVGNCQVFIVYWQNLIKSVDLACWPMIHGGKKVRWPSKLNLTQQYTNIWEARKLFSVCTVFLPVDVLPLGYGWIYNVFSNEKRYHVIMGNYPSCSSLNFVTMAAHSLGGCGAWVQCKHIYHVLLTIMYCGMIEDFIHYCMWSWEEVFNLLMCIKAFDN